MCKISKEDIRKNAFNIFLCIIYATILAFVYAFWAHQINKPLWITLTVAAVFIISGIIAAYISTKLSIKIKTNNEK